MVYQQQSDDCGVAAVATLLGLSYDDVAAVWLSATGKCIGPSTYKDLKRVILQLTGKQCTQVWNTKSTCRRIVRARPYKGSATSHWIVVNDDGSLWCPYSGFHETRWEYEQPEYGQCLFITNGDDK